jgi:DNA-binding response OmpR family regulator
MQLVERGVFVSFVKEAMEESENQPFDLIISVTQLREESGISLLEAVRENCPETIRFLLVNKTELAEMRSMISAAQQRLVQPIQQGRFILRYCAWPGQTAVRSLCA